MNYSPIEWTDFTSNPLQYRDADGNVVWGCIHASPGCMKCYSEALAKRYGRGGKFDVATMEGLTPFINEKEIHSILTYKPASGKMCFLGDMTDIFGDWVPFELIDQIFAAMAMRPDVTFQVLTKRADRMKDYLISRSKSIEFWEAGAQTTGRTLKFKGLDGGYFSMVPFPLNHVWLGVSAENQQYADERIPLLLQTPAAKRFVSYEPALGAVQFDSMIASRSTDGPAEVWNSLTGERHTSGEKGGYTHKDLPSLDWIIVGGESGPGARPFDIQWARSIVQQCKAADVPLFVKQMGSKPIFTWNPEQDAAPKGMNRKGGDMSEWPEDLRIRQFPGEDS